MLSFQIIDTIATPGFFQAWQLYEEAFPEVERRSLEQQTTLLANPAYQFLSIVHDGAFAGLFGVWQLAGGTFLEHFAVSPALRGKGIGAEALQVLVKNATQPVILEVEPPLSNLAQRRIRFYERAGFHVNDFYYQQPPYGDTKPWVELRLMSFPYSLKAAELEKVKNQVYRLVYGQAV